MAGQSRRSIVKSILAAPIVAGIVDQLSPTSRVIAHERPRTREYLRELEAVNVLRMLNTLQREQLRDSGHYARLSELEQSPTVRAVLDSKGAAEREMGRSRFEVLDLRKGGTEIDISGWRLDFLVDRNQTKYAATIQDALTDKLPSFGTDDAAYIHKGRAVAVPSSDRWRTVGELIVGGRIGSPPKKKTIRRLSALLQHISSSIVAPVHAEHCLSQGEEYRWDCCCLLECCHDYGCSGGTCCYCQGAPPGGITCWNCGCECCAWMCCCF